MTDSADRLESWKEIAAYLHRDVRTVQRWEAAEGLPVHRHQHKKRGSVFALRSELDHWRSSRQEELFGGLAGGAAPPAPTRRPWPLAAGSLAGLGLVVAAAFWIGGGREVPTSPPDARAWDGPRILAEATREGASIQRIPMGEHVHTILAAPDDRTVFVETCDAPPGRLRVHGLDVSRRAVKWTVDAGAVGACGPMALTPEGDYLLIGDRSDVVVIDTARQTTRRIRTAATAIRDLAVAPGGRVYLAAVFQGLLVLDLETGASHAISQLPCPVGLAIDTRGRRLYVSYQCSGPGGRPGHDAFEVFDTASNASVATITGPPSVGSHLLLTPDGRQLWADGMDACISPSYDHAGCPSSPSGVVNVIRAHDRVLLRSIAAGSSSDFELRLSATPEGRGVIVGGGRTTVLSTSSFADVESTPLPLRSNMAFSRDGRTAYAALGDPRAVAILPFTRQPAPHAGLSGRWTLDGQGGDSAGANDFAELDDQAFGPGRIGGALRLPRPEGVRLDHPTNLDLDSARFTATAWVKAEPPHAASGDDRAMTVMEYAAQHADGVYGWNLFIRGDGRPVFCLGWFDQGRCAGPRATMVIGDQTLAFGRWYHLAVGRSGDTLALYVDGHPAGMDETRGGFPVVRQLWFRLGSNEAGTSPLTGRLDEVELYNRALTQQEIIERGK